MLTLVHVAAAVSAMVMVMLLLQEVAPTPLRRVLALLAADQFAWNVAAVGDALTGFESFRLLGAVAAPFFTPLAFHAVLAFIGARVRLRRLLWSSYVVHAGVALPPLVELVVPGRQVDDGPAWFAALLLTCSLPFAALGIGLVVQHLRSARSSVERLRSRVLLFALTLVTVLLPMDPLADAHLPVPHLSTLGSLVFNALLTWLAVGLGVVRVERTSRRTVGFGVLALLAFAATTLSMVRSAGDVALALSTGTLVVGVVLGVSFWLWWSTERAARSSLERLASVGRFSAQMAHDLKNPLAAAKGAAELLVEEMRRQGAAEQQQFASLVVNQLDRLHAVIERYRKLSALDPEVASVNLGALVRSVLSLQRFAAGSEVTIRTELDDALNARVDADLLSSALENLIQNALEALPGAGVVTVRTRKLERDQPWFELSVHDTGPGFDPRAQEQAFELFFTTKATGSGLGLAFVREVARAHGGDAALSSSASEGTTVAIQLPLL